MVALEIRHLELSNSHLTVPRHILFVIECYDGRFFSLRDKNSRRADLSVQLVHINTVVLVNRITQDE